MNGRWLVLALFLTFPAFARAEEPKKVEAKREPLIELKPGKVPFRLTDTHHTLVRVKINGKGPFNFVVDTGCPVFLIAEPVAEKIGLKKGWVTLDKLELEGGLEMNKIKARVETPFQIEGMNGMGLAGVELHGLMGYTVLAKYKMEFDFRKKEMVWTPVKTEPMEPQKLMKKGAKDVAGGGMDMMIAAVKILTLFAGVGPAPPPQPRGFFGFELEQKDDAVIVARVLADGPAAKAGLKKGDRIVNVNDKEISAVAEVLQHASKITAGRTLTLTIERDEKQQELKITAGDGL
jgi:PDZ domain/Aspartyl protease